MAKDSEKILGMAINSLIKTGNEEEVNDLVKSCLEMSKVAVDKAFGFVEEDIQEQVGNALTRSTFIDIMKRVDNIAHIPNIQRVCESSDAFKKAKNFMKVASPRFFDELRPIDADMDERAQIMTDEIKRMYDKLKTESDRSTDEYWKYWGGLDNRRP